MLWKTLIAFCKPSRGGKSRRAVRGRWSVERLEDRCLLDSCFSQVFTTQHLDLGFDYVDGVWDVAVEGGDDFPPSQSAPAQTLLWGAPEALRTQPEGPEWDFLGAGAGNPVWILPQAQDTQLLFLGGAAEETPPGTFASYLEEDPRVGVTFAWVKWSLHAVRGPGEFSLYQTNFDGSRVVWMSTADGIGSSDVTFIPEQGHVHFNWAFTQRGLYEVDLQASAFLNDGSMTPTSSPVVTFYFAIDPVLQVTSLTPTETGFVAHFNRPFDAGALNLYDSALASRGAADVTLNGPSGEVRGSLVLEGINCVRFIRTGGVLEPGDYTVTLRSGDDAFKTSPLGTQGTLDGNSDGTPGDDYVSTFTISAAPAVAVGLPEFTRGPGQPVNVPASETGLPLQVSDGADVTAVDLTLRYDPALLTLSDATLATGLPEGSTVTLTVTMPGTALLSFRSPTVVGPGPRTLALLSAAVPADASYGAKHVLDVTDLLVNDGAIAARDDDGFHVVGHLGDASGNGQYSSFDASLALRVGIGLDTGFSAYPLADPAVVADTNGDNFLSTLDATHILQEAVGIDRPEIPPLAGPLPLIPPNGPAALLSFATTAVGRPGEAVVLPLDLDVSDGLQAADLAISYDPTRLDVLSEADVLPGDLTADFDLFLVNLDREAGVIRVGLGRTAGPLAERGPGSVLQIRFQVRDDAAAGPTIINLQQRFDATTTGLNEGGLTLTPAPDDAAGDALDGLITVDPCTENTASPSTEDTVRPSTARAVRDEFFRRLGDSRGGNAPRGALLAELTGLLLRRRRFS